MPSSKQSTCSEGSRQVEIGAHIFGILVTAPARATIKMLSTLLIPTGAEVDGFDVVRDEVHVRRRLGVLFGGDKGLYNQLSGRENLRTSGVCTACRVTSSIAVGGALGPRNASTRGMKQRLHIAKTLIHRPCDPRRADDRSGPCRCHRGAVSHDLSPEVMLSTHDMHEADLAIIDRGLIVAAGTPCPGRGKSTVVLSLGPSSAPLVLMVAGLLSSLPATLTLRPRQHRRLGPRVGGAAPPALPCAPSMFAIHAGRCLPRGHRARISR